MGTIGNSTSYSPALNTNGPGASSAINSPASDTNIDTAKGKKFSFIGSLKKIGNCIIKFFKNNPKILIGAGAITALVGVGTGNPGAMAGGVAMVVTGFAIKNFNNLGNANQASTMNRAPAG